MPGTSLVVVEDSSRSAVSPRRPRRSLRSYLLAGLALSGWVGFALLAGVLLVSRPGRSPTVESAPIVAEVPAVLVGPVVLAEPWVPTPFPIQVGPAQAIPRGGWMKISGMPALASLSAGHIIGRGIWKVPIAGLSTLGITAPARETVGSEIHVALMSADGSLIAEVRSVLSVMPAALCGAGSLAAASPMPDDFGPGAVSRPSSRAALPILIGREDRIRAQELALKGDIHRVQGRIESARGYYEAAAGMGLPRAAMALARTFDPNEVTGTVRGDPENARAWYKRARELLTAATEYYLKRLDTEPAGAELHATRLIGAGR